MKVHQIAEENGWTDKAILTGHVDLSLEFVSTSTPPNDSGEETPYFLVEGTDEVLALYAFLKKHLEDRI